MTAAALPRPSTSKLNSPHTTMQTCQLIYLRLRLPAHHLWKRHIVAKRTSSQYKKAMVDDIY